MFVSLNVPSCHRWAEFSAEIARGVNSSTVYESEPWRSPYPETARPCSRALFWSADGIWWILVHRLIREGGLGTSYTFAFSLADKRRAFILNLLELLDTVWGALAIRKIRTRLIEPKSFPQKCQHLLSFIKRVMDEIADVRPVCMCFHSSSHPSTDRSYSRRWLMLNLRSMPPLLMSIIVNPRCSMSKKLKVHSIGGNVPRDFPTGNIHLTGVHFVDVFST
jgi:hypothetical protein